MSTQKHTGMFIEAQFITVKKWKQPKSPSFDKWINKSGINISGYHSTNKGMKYWIHATTQMDFENSC